MDNTSNTDTPRKPSAIMPIVKGFAVLAVLVTVQVVAASVLLPNPSQTEKLARDILAAKSDGEDKEETGGEGQGEHADSETAKHAATEEGEHEELIEVKIGDFSVTRFNPKTEATINVDFEVWATVGHDEEKEYEELFDKHKNRIKEQINFTVHAAEAADLRDRGLGLLKRRILEKTNRALGKPLIHELLFTRFNFLEH